MCAIILMFHSYHFKTESECLNANMYPLVNCPITMENHHFIAGYSSTISTGPCSTAVLT